MKSKHRVWASHSMLDPQGPEGGAWHREGGHMASVHEGKREGRNEH